MLLQHLKTFDKRHWRVEPNMVYKGKFVIMLRQNARKSTKDLLRYKNKKYGFLQAVFFYDFVSLCFLAFVLKAFIG